MKNIISIYTPITSRGRYNLSVANEINAELLGDNPSTYELLKRNKKVIEGCHLGCCINFSLYLMEKLKENGIHSMLIATPEGNGKKTSVAYEKNGSWFVADIVEDIKFLSKIENDYARENSLQPVYRKEIRKNFREHFYAHYEIPLEDFKKEHEYVEMYADIFSYEGKMSDFFKSGHKI